MKSIRLQYLTLNNFKGIKHLEINFNGEDTNIYGDNETGKTTIVDSFMWLFFNKDSEGASNFGIKFKLPSGEIIHNQEHCVEAVLSVDGVETTFKKIFKEKYTKQRGSNIETFTGHTTDYFVDDVPKKKKEYDDIVNQLFDAKILPIITDPFYFNKKMDWKERRKMLIEICGNIQDAAVIATHGELKPLEAILENKSIDDYRAQLKSQMTPINAELKAIPSRIDEASRAIPESIESVDEKLIADVEKRIADLESEKSKILNGGAIAEKEAERIKMQNRKLLIKDEIPDTQKLREELNGLIFKNSRLENEIAISTNTIKRLSDLQKDNQDDRDELRAEYAKENERSYDESKNICPTCKRELPAEQIAGFIEEFNINKSKKLEKLNARGKTLKKVFDQRAEEIKEQEEIRDKKADELAENRKAIALKEKEIGEIERSFKLSQQPKLDKCDEEIIRINREIDYLKDNALESIKPIDEAIATFKSQKSQFDEIKAQQIIAENQKKRITELEAREKQLADEYSDKEQMLWLTDEFVKAKVAMLTENINSHFQICKFKLFNQNINGGIEECCEVTYKGVGYHDLNNAAKINTGLDVINTVCNYSGLFAPIFVDNCESINHPIATQSQQIKLYVTEDKQLKFKNK